MGNCSLRAVADAAHEDALRTTPPTISPFVASRKNNGVWKVKMMIDPRDLERILSEGVNTEALIERMRLAANSTPRRGIKTSWGDAVSYKCATSSDRTVQPTRNRV